MTRLIGVASVLAVLSVSQLASAQAYESSFRFGLGLDYAGLAGRGDGGAGGLRLTLGARLHDHFGVYYQGQALAGAFVSGDEVLATFMGWNAVLAEANLEIFSLGVGPSLDATARCTFATAQGASGSGACLDYVAPGLAARAGLRFGALSFSGDLHVTFDEDRGPDVWVLFGVGMSLGDVASRPMTMPWSTPPPVEAERPSAEAREAGERRAARRRPRPEPSAQPGGLGRRLDDPAPGRVESSGRVRADGSASVAPSARPEASPDVAPDPAPASELVYRAPAVRRFESRHVTTHASPSPAVEPRARARPRPRLEGLPSRGSDDPLEGLDSATAPE